jgi:hypothetical protein
MVTAGTTDYDSTNEYSIVPYRTVLEQKYSNVHHWHVNIGIRHDGPGQAARRIARNDELGSLLWKVTRAAHVNIIANALIVHVFTVT